MITLLGTLIGFLSSAFPEFIKLFSDGAKRKHEFSILQFQSEQQKQGHVLRLDEIQAQADIAEGKALYKTYYTGIKWVDALNGTVRPVLAYAFFVLYACIKITQFNMIEDGNVEEMLAIWTVEDQAIFAGIISFYFGQRAMTKMRASK